MNMTPVFAVSALAAGAASWFSPHALGSVGFILMDVFLGLGVIAAISGLLPKRPPA